MRRPIASSLSPNTTGNDVILALQTFFSPWVYFQNSATRNLEKWFYDYFSASEAVSFNSGRSALFVALKTLGIGKGDEVMLQSFTCVALPNAILAAEATPVYIDIDKKLSMDPKDVEKKITTKTKAIIVQYTFGIPADIEKIVALAKKHNIFVIEDCAHGIGATVDGKKLGTFGDIAFFSFGRDKAFSCVSGGLAITHNKVLGEKIRANQRKLPTPSYLWSLQQLFHPIAFAVILPFYNIVSLGKVLLVVLQKLHVLSFPVSQKERQGIFTQKELGKLPNNLSVLALFQLSRLDEMNRKREKFADMYLEAFSKEKTHILSEKSLPYLRFPMLFDKRDEIVRTLRAKNMYLGTWYAHVIDPKGVIYAKIGYTKGMCPNAESLSQTIINLPCYPTMTHDDVKTVIKEVEAYV